MLLKIGQKNFERAKKGANGRKHLLIPVPGIRTVFSTLGSGSNFIYFACLLIYLELAFSSQYHYYWCKTFDEAFISMVAAAKREREKKQYNGRCAKKTPEMLLTRFVYGLVFTM